MARPKKTGLNYFPFDVDMFSDMKIRKLIKYQGGKAVAVYASLLCLIYKSGYYMRWDEELPFIISEMTGFEEVYISEVIKSCLALGLFSKELYGSAGILTSAGLQERYNSINKMIGRKCEICEFSLISSEVSVGVSSQETGVSSQETGVSSQEMGGFFPENATNKKKIKENKINIHPLQDVVELWNSTCTDFPKIQKLSDSRKQKIKLRLAEWGKTPEEQKAKAADIFKKIQASSFLRGDNPNGWQATFDWLFSNDKNWIKVAEGNYDNRSKPVQGNKLNTRNANKGWE